MPGNSVNLASMFGWVASTFDLVRKGMGPLLGASALTLGLGLLLCVPLWLVMAFGMMRGASAGASPAMPFGGDMTMFWAAYGFTILVGLVLFPPILAGWFRLCRALDGGEPASAFDIFATYRDASVWRRGIGFGILAFVLYAAALLLAVLPFMDSIREFMAQMQAQQLAAMAGITPPPPKIPPGLVLAYFAFIGAAMFLQFVYMVGYAEIALRPTAVFAAMSRAATVVLRHAHKLLVFLLAISFAAMVFLVVFALLLAVVVAVLTFIHPALGVLAVLVLYLPFLLCIYPLMFAGNYFAWKGFCGDDPPSMPADGSGIAA